MSQRKIALGGAFREKVKNHSFRGFDGRSTISGSKVKAK